MARGVHVLMLCLTGAVLAGAYPRDYFTLLAEPNDPVSTVPFQGKLTRGAALARVTALRTIMAARDIQAYIVPTADAHNSQYIAACDARREWLSGLSGSSGTAVVTASDALVWTDARYFTQFDMQVDTSVWSLMRQGTDATIDSWLAANLPANSAVGVDPTTYTRTAWTALETALSAVNVRLVAVAANLVDEVRRTLDDAPPTRPNEPLITLAQDFSGKASSAKISELMAQMNSRGVSALILTALDDVAYTLNLRGSDIPYNPVFFAYLVIRTDLTANNVILFWGDGQLADNIVQFLTSEQTAVDARPYSDIITYLSTLSTGLPAGSTVWLSRDASHAIYQAAETNNAISTLSTVSPVALMKCIKNEVELKGFRNAHVKDGLAVVRFLRWVHEQVDAGVEVTEIDVVKKLDELRGEELDYFGPSFSTIAGAGENGAVIHYKPSPEGDQRVIRKGDMLLVDSGGQYRDGTTDITRTRHMSAAPTDKQRLAFTRVLQGQILLGTAVFPRGVMGNVLETLARKALWDVGLNYGHGTGHGVGHFLNVHEGPSGILSSPSATDPGISAGMIFSDEPGYYEVGEYGIRHEDLVEVIEMNKDADHIYAEGLVGDFDGVGALGFYTISLAPHQTACLDVNLLNEHEIKYINDYHARVLSTLGPILLERNLTEDYEWLQRECSPIHRSSAGLFKLSPLLFISTLTIWFRV